MAFKRVNPKHLRIGMYIVRLEGDWLDHPFWRSGFVLSSINDLKKLVNSNIKAVVIDDSKGVDIPKPGQPSPSTDRQRAFPPKAFRSSSDMRSLQVAESVRQCHRAMRQIFAETRMGRIVSPDTTTKIVAEITHALDANPAALVRLTRLRSIDTYTYLHSIAVSALMVGFSQHLKFDDNTVQLMGLAGLMHDIGKVTISPVILAKPGALDESETAIIRTHPMSGHGILESSGFPEIVLDVALHHHEKIDGSGYPNHLGPDISSHARIAAICDVYDAVTSVRPYKRTWTPVEALTQMSRWDGHFDAAYFSEFVAWLNHNVNVVIPTDAPRVAFATNGYSDPSS